VDSTLGGIGSYRMAHVGGGGENWPRPLAYGGYQLLHDK
jgi:hypothetical protein